MSPKGAVATFFLLLIGCHFFPAHGGGGEEVSGGARRRFLEEEKQVSGLCIDSPCDADPNKTCFCCTRLPNEPCYDTLQQCFKVCPNCNFLVCPPPPAAAAVASTESSRTQLGSAPVPLP